MQKILGSGLFDLFGLYSGLFFILFVAVK